MTTRIQKHTYKHAPIYMSMIYKCVFFGRNSEFMLNHVTNSIPKCLHKKINQFIFFHYLGATKELIFFF